MNVGLEAESCEPHPRATPCTKVVFPAPRSPCRQITSPVCKTSPRRVPIRRVCSGLGLKKSIVCSSRMGTGRIISGGWILPQDRYTGIKVNKYTSDTCLLVYLFTLAYLSVKI